MLVASRLAARIGTTQPRQREREDALARLLDAEIKRIWKSIRAMVQQRTPHMGRRIAELMHAMGVTSMRVLTQGLAQQAIRVRQDTTKQIVATVPRKALALVANTLPVTEARRATPAEAEQIGRMLFPPLTPIEATSVVYAPSSVGGSWQGRMNQLTALAAPDQVAALVNNWAASGEPPRALEQQLLPVMLGVQSAARRVARTEGQRVANSVRMATYEGLDDLIIGYQVHATMDSRTRPHHAARNGNVYYKQPKPGQLGLRDMPHPPIEEDGTVAHNCRCYLSPVMTVDQELLNDPAAVALFTNNENNLIPDPAVYSQWFAGAPDQHRRYAVGSGRMSIVQDQLQPGEQLTWQHFLDPATGQLLDREYLQNETPQARRARLETTNDVLSRRQDLLQQVSKYGFLTPADDDYAAPTTNVAPVAPLPPSVLALGLSAVARQAQPTTREEPVIIPRSTQQQSAHPMSMTGFQLIRYVPGEGDRFELRTPAGMTMVMSLEDAVRALGWEPRQRRVLRQMAAQERRRAGVNR